ncbi:MULTISPECIES: DUF2510 domain-containing protein [Rhodococcus]|uniref:DUF2510 domain-containing protein n=1 Tax=Rhodococcus TaxID=1827 RepID=UPI000C9BFD63|nr:MULTISPECIES: DUF2510 domain-containing protein [Rhodococcus]PND49816.1 hypothetical protein CQZ88_22650 [Rhodococcus sp. ENV425]WKW99587.1 DUF2510 domain-containing protein [Rhodococcus aetherivorans]
MAIELRPDIQAAKDRLTATVGAGRELKNLESHLWEGERVDMLCVGQYGKGQGLLALTDRRLMFVFHGILGQTTEDFPLDKISSIQWGAGMLLGTITIFASGNKAEVKSVAKTDGKALVDRVRALISGQVSPVPAQAAPVQYASTSTPPPPPSVPAGWYPDPHGAQVQRYWDGRQWTEHTAPLG